MAIGNYIDALYLTVVMLTTTGFGDMTLPGTAGRLLSILMMIVGVSLFVRMVQVLFRPTRVLQSCSYCGLSGYESDAVHCKRCGTLLTSEPTAKLVLQLP
jgi:voltage-gated potassium channel